MVQDTPVVGVARRRATAVGFVLAAFGLTMLIPSGPPDAHAGAATDGAVTAVSIAPANPGLRDPVTVDIGFCVPRNTHSADTFSLTLPVQLLPLTTGFAVRDENRNVVANATVAAGVLSLTMTPYASSHVGVCGSMYYQASMVSRYVAPNRLNKFSFISADKVFTASVTPVLSRVPSPAQPLDYGTWTDVASEDRSGASGALTWYVQAPRADSRLGFPSLIFDTAVGEGQSFDCGTVDMQAGDVNAAGDYNYLGPYAGTLSTQCTPERVRVTTGAVQPGVTLRLCVQASVSDAKLSAYAGSGAVTVGRGHAVEAVARSVARAQAGGTASGVPQSGSSYGISAVHTSRASSSWTFSRTASLVLVVVVVLLGGLLAFALRRRGRRMSAG